MTAVLVTFSDPAFGNGGEFEKLCFRTLRDSLPSCFFIATNVPIARGKGAFYECDAIIMAPGVCDILEMKCIKPYVEVYEDFLRGINEYSIDRVFSILDSKGKVLKSRREKRPFLKSQPAAHKPWISTFVVVPDDCEIKVCYKPYDSNRPIKQLGEVVRYYSELATNNLSLDNRTYYTELLSSWIKFRDMSSTDIQRNNRYLGQYLIKRRLRSAENIFEYHATDKPPCAMDVHLKEYPFDTVASVDKIGVSLDHLSREMRTLRQVRHPHVACVIGHFQTGSSLVQISDWFDGRPLEELWQTVSDVSIEQKLDFFLKIVRALEFCHTKGVFHRALSAATILVDESLDDLRLTGFEFAKDLNRSMTVPTAELSKRDPRLIPPEELTMPGKTNHRVGDIFQAGILLYRLLENGDWPFEDTLAYCESNGKVRTMRIVKNEQGMDSIQKLVLDMLAIPPKSRPDPLAKVASDIQNVLAG
jgi:serine/threonine protein kinase